MNILIIEDEKAAATRLINQVITINPDAHILDCIDSVESAIKWLNRNPNPDLIFLDVQLSDGVCFEIFEKVQVNSPVIMTTAYNEYAIKAFELNSIDYLLKPISIEKLAQSLQKLETIKNLFYSETLGHSFIVRLTKYINGKEAYRSRFLIPQHDGFVPVMIDDIAYFSTDSKNVIITTHKNTKYAFRYSLDKLEEELEPNTFWRANRTYILSDKSIVKVHNYFNYKLKLELSPNVDADVVISRKRVSKFKEWYNS
jgi:DNA-binding LytR/AlgR family response regulator